MKKAILATILVLVANLAFAQKTVRFSTSPSYAGGTYYSPAYNFQTTVYGGGSQAGGTYSVTFLQPFITLADGRAVPVFATNASITIGSASNRETVTPSSVANCNVPVNPAGTYCTVTATFTYAHGKGDFVTSGTGGLQEAINDASNNGGGQVYYQKSELMTLSTGGTTTDSSANLLAANSLVMGVQGVVTTTITGSCTGWALGDASGGTRFTASQTTLTAGTQNGTLSNFAPTQASAAKARITCAGGAASAGAVRVSVWGYVLAPPTSVAQLF